MRLFYTFIFYLLLPLVALRLYWRGRKAPAYRLRWRERFGFVAKDIPVRQKPETIKPNKILSASAPLPVIWLHAVSVGETVAALPLIEQLLRRYPNHRLMLTNSTPTGSAQVKKSLGNRVWHSYAPYDLPDSIHRFLNRVRPEILIIMETELWPNTIAACAKRNIPVVLANARLSEKSAKGYGRLKSLSYAMLQNLSHLASQHEDDQKRFIDLGFPAERSQVTGNIKFDLNRSEALLGAAKKLKAQWNSSGQRLIFLAASTHRGEDQQVLAAFTAARQECPELLLVLVPRHPERFAEVLSLSRAQFSQVSCRSLGEDIRIENTGKQSVIVADTMGEMMCLLGASDLVFVGGSLVPSGGHNMIEPAHWGLPILSGPSLYNFAEASRLLRQADAMNVVADQEELAQRLIKLSTDPELRRVMGERAMSVAESNRGALDKLLALIEKVIR